MAYNFRPGGYEDDAEEFDGDGFCFSGPLDDQNIKNKVFDPVGATDFSAGSTPRGGFGKPVPKPKETEMKYRRAADLQDEAETKPLNIGDFQMAIIRGTTDRVKQYLTLGFKADTPLKSSWTGLMYAANSANLEIVKLLLDSGANPNFHIDQYTVLMAACGAHGYQEDDVLAVVDLLLEKGASVNTYDRYHMSPLIFAAREGHTKVVERLAEKGAMIDKQDNRGWTALAWAVSKKRKATVQKLMWLKADPRKKHTNGQTVINMAENNADYEMLELLEGKKRDQNFPDVVQHTQGSLTSSTQPSVTSGKESYGTTYGDLELFLCGLDLSQLVDLVRSHNIDFNTFLRITDEDLVKMGISQLGVRKKILDGVMSVHKKDWEKSSLPQLQYNKQVSCAEALAVVANISRHTKYISTTVGFLQDQLKAKPQILEQMQDGTGPKQLHRHTVDTLHNVAALEKQLKALGTLLEKTLQTGNYDPPDILDKRSPEKLQHRTRLPIYFLAASSVAIVIWKKDFLWSKINQLFGKNL